MNLDLLMNSDTLICICILVFPIGIIEVSKPENEVFSFISVPCTNTDLQVPENLNKHLVVRNGRMWKTCFSATQIRKNIISWNIKTKCVTNFFYWQIGVRVWRIIHVITWWAHNRQKFTLISIKMWILIYIVYT